MPSIVDIQSRDIYVLVEFSLKEINKIMKLMDLIELKYDGTKKEEVETQKYLMEEFYPFFEKLKKDLEENAPNS